MARRFQRKAAGRCKGVVRAWQLERIWWLILADGRRYLECGDSFLGGKPEEKGDREFSVFLREKEPERGSFLKEEAGYRERDIGENLERDWFSGRWLERKIYEREGEGTGKTERGVFAVRR